MLKKHEQLRIHNMLEEGMSVADIALRTGWSLGTIYKYKRLDKKLVGGRFDKNCIPNELKPYEVFLDTEIKKQKMKPNELFYELQRRGYTGKRKIFDIYINQRTYSLRPRRTIRLIETSPGEQAQVDWAHFGTINLNGTERKLSMFVYILSYSRLTYAEFVVSQKQQTLQACHIHAFNKLGIPKTILYDNMRTVVKHNKSAAGGAREVSFTQDFVHFARYYQFQPRACVPHDPQSKGKVERKIKQIRTQFSRLTPRMSVNLDELNARLTEWLDDTAKNVVHSTTREKPYDRWLREKSQLTFPENIPVYNPLPFETHYTTQFGLLTRNRVIYNLGTQFARMKLEVHERQEHGLAYLDIYRNNKLIVTAEIPVSRRGYVEVSIPYDEVDKRIPNRKAPREKLAPEFIVSERDLGYYSLDLEGGLSHG